MKWRKVKKLFKKNKGKYIGLCVTATQKDGRTIDAIINDVRIYPEHGKRCGMQFDATPQFWKPVEDVINQYEQEYERVHSNHGFSVSCEMSLEKPSPKILKTLKRL